MCPQWSLSFWFIFLSCFISPHEFSKLSLNISTITSELLPDCKLFIIYNSFSYKEPRHWKSKFIDIISEKSIISNSAGVTNIVSQNKPFSSTFTSSELNPFLPNLTHRPYRTLYSEKYCHSVILILPEGIPSEYNAEQALHSRLNLPLLNPLISRNEDKFIIVSGIKSKDSLYKSNCIFNLKYKLFVWWDESNQELKFQTYCAHCPIKEFETRVSNSKDFDYFPDFQKTFHSYQLKVSATDKLPGLLEIETYPNTQIHYPKRGVYASALLHLAQGLNFTYELYRSSGGGSTGHPLPNGTWVGTVGDVVAAKVDFGLVCGMTFIRHPVIELCATITFEYISFAIGPPARIFTWKAIFWPFNPFLWFGMMASSLLVIIVSYFLLKYSPEKSWGTGSIAQYLPKTFIEQADELPSNLSQSVRIILGYWLLFSMILSTLYRAKMVTFMTFPVMEKAPDTFDQLAKSKYDIQFHYFGNVAYNTFKTSTNPTYVTIFQKMFRQPNPLECLKGTLAKPSACILFGCVYEELINRNLSDKFGQSPIRISPNYGFMYTPGVLHEKKAPFSSNFKWILQNSMQMGLNQQWEKTDLLGLLKARNRWLKDMSPEEREKNKFQYEDDGDDDVLHLKHLKGAFTVLFVGLFFAICIFIWEKWVRKLIARILRQPETASQSFIAHHLKVMQSFIIKKFSKKLLGKPK